ncbi:ABC transporter ATP-binding protein [Altericista sp. CCNU0014]|uniref:ABC transporter ATP-binding protein n=1 Tax=Altericista sp. CCNU0014 TaxID=3082949 RepID=UPI003850BBB2
MKRQEKRSNRLWQMPQIFQLGSRWQSARRLMQVGKQVSRKPLYIGFVATIVAALLDGAGIGLTIPFLQLLLSENTKFKLPELPFLQEQALWLLGQPKGVLLSLFSIILLASVLLKVVFSYWADDSTNIYLQNVVALFRKRLYEKYLHAPITFFDNEKMGTLSNMMSEIHNINILMSWVISLFIALSVLTAYIATMVLLSWQLTLLIIVLIAGVGLGLNRLLKKIKPLGRAEYEAREAMHIRYLDTLAGVRIVQSYATQDFELKRFNQLCDSVRDRTMLSLKKMRLIDPLTELATMTVALLILVCSYNFLIVKGLLGTSELLTFMLALIKILPVTKRINAARGAIQQFSPSLAVVADTLSSEHTAALVSGTRKLDRLQKGISFRNVSFSYNGRTNAIEDFNLEIPYGQTVALVGFSGAGKSTVAVLVPRFYDVTKGSIEIDGCDIRDYDLNSLRRCIGTVSQDTYIFNTSIRENIAYGLEDVSDEQVVEAARFANADEFIQQLSAGYDTLVGDRGVQLSGGQRQRISIARAILRDPDILILDEATSALDSQSERLVQEALERLRQNRTVLTIAHRLSTIRNADCIVVMEKGRIVESGQHERLLSQKGTYWSFHNVQSVPIS